MGKGEAVGIVTATFAADLILLVKLYYCLLVTPVIGRCIDVEHFLSTVVLQGILFIVVVTDDDRRLTSLVVAEANDLDWFFEPCWRCCCLMRMVSRCCSLMMVSCRLTMMVTVPEQR